MAIVDNKKVVFLETLCEKYLNEDEKLQKSKENVETVRKEILDFLVENEEKSYPYYLSEDSKEKVTFIVSNKASVNYDLEKIKGILDKKTISQFVDRTFEINYDGFANLCKKYNIPKEEAFELLTINEKVNNSKLKQLSDSGKIDLNKLKGTFTIDKSTYLTVRKSGK